MIVNNTYFILRHGQTVWQTRNRDYVYPKSDSAKVRLTEIGEKAIQTAARQLKKKKIDFIFSSDFFRARQTSGIVAKALGLKVNFDKRLRDINLGIYLGGTKKEFYKKFPDPNGRFSKRPKDGESWNDVKKRILDFFLEIDKKYKNKNILIISHGDPLWLLEGVIRGLTQKELLDEIFSKKSYIKTGELRKLA